MSETPAPSSAVEEDTTGPDPTPVRDLVAAVVIVAFGLFYLAQARQLPEGVGTGLGPSSFPVFIAWSMIVLGAGLVAVSSWRWVRARGAQSPGRAADVPHGHDRSGDVKVVGVFGLVVAYAVVLPLVGFLIATPVFATAVKALIDGRVSRGTLISLVGFALFAVAVYFIFKEGLNITLPSGPFA